ncbi:piggyBac transposable element-derived protein 3-like [Anabrus simplex]|uniref:piggyBac transposable element-derived protein 3-like n=1 Tax=Anabrus simplex TaxID=316456 RepID=UPI0035A363F5
MAEQHVNQPGSSRIHPNDVDTILSLLENGDVSDLEDLVSDTEDNDNEPVLIHQRVGADVETRESGVLTAGDSGDQESANHDDGDEYDEMFLTDRSDIRWRHKPIIPFDAQFEYSECFSDLEVLSPIEYCRRYLPEQLFQEMSQKTNIYALQNDVSFKPTTPEEIEVLFGLNIAMGAIKYPRIRMYWDSATGLDLFKSSMARNRFFQIRNNLHLVDTLQKPENNDRFWKVRPIYNYIRKQCLDLEIEKIISIDEQMIPFRGQLNVKQYVKGKPFPWGIKLFALCGKSGLAYDFLLYQGSTTELDPTALKLYGLGPSVVLHLCNRLSHSGHELYYDNYFSSYHLLQVLKSKNIFAGGTIRTNRFSNPPLISDKMGKKKERGYSEEVSSADGDVVVVKWFDSRGVVLASNYLGIGKQDKVKRWDKANAKYIEIPRPELVMRYNHGMGGVDLFDQLISLYRIFLRCKKWTLRMIFHAVDFAVVNSWLEYRRDAQKAGILTKDILDLLEFRLQVAEAFVKVGKPCRGTKRGRPSTSPDYSPLSTKQQRKERRPLREVQTDTVDHLPEHDCKKEPTRCKQVKCTQRSHIFCRKCEVHLCINRNRNCFALFHKR